MSQVTQRASVTIRGAAYGNLDEQQQDRAISAKDDAYEEVVIVGVPLTSTGAGGAGVPLECRSFTVDQCRTQHHQRPHRNLTRQQTRCCHLVLAQSTVHRRHRARGDGAAAAAGGASSQSAEVHQPNANDHWCLCLPGGGGSATDENCLCRPKNGGSAGSCFCKFPAPSLRQSS